jgi:hypothetical protein
VRGEGRREKAERGGEVDKRSGFDQEGGLTEGGCE